jgi:hypothetical protein
VGVAVAASSRANRFDRSWQSGRNWQNVGVSATAKPSRKTQDSAPKSHEWGEPRRGATAKVEVYIRAMKLTKLKTARGFRG